MSLSHSSIAAIAHEANRVYCQSIGDDSQPHWEDAPEWQRKSAILGVQHTAENPNSSPRDSHESWLKTKREEGWVYGPVKNPDLKQHPCMVEYEELPQSQQLKDAIFQGVVRSLLKAGHA